MSALQRGVLSCTAQSTTYLSHAILPDHQSDVRSIHKLVTYTLNRRTAEADLEHLVHLRRQWRSAGNHLDEVASEQIPDLLRMRFVSMLKPSQGRCATIPFGRPEDHRRYA